MKVKPAKRYSAGPPAAHCWPDSTGAVQGIRMTAHARPNGTKSSSSKEIIRTRTEAAWDEEDSQRHHRQQPQNKLPPYKRYPPASTVIASSRRQRPDWRRRWSSSCQDGIEVVTAYRQHQHATPDGTYCRYPWFILVRYSTTDKAIGAIYLMFREADKAIINCAPTPEYQPANITAEEAHHQNGFVLFIFSALQNEKRPQTNVVIFQKALFPYAQMNTSG